LYAGTVGNQATVHMSANAPNAVLDRLTDHSDLSITLDLKVEVQVEGRDIKATVEGTHNQYPAYEVYVGERLLHSYDNTEGIGGIEPGVVRLVRGLRSEVEVSASESWSVEEYNPGVFVELPGACR
jgi:hypothetical protein